MTKEHLEINEKGDDWEQDLEIQVVPCSLTQFWEAFLADDAPYYYMMVEDRLDEPLFILTDDDWYVAEDEEFFGKKVI